MLTRHFRAGLLIVPSLRDWVCCLDKPLAHSTERALLSSTVFIQSWKKLIWTSLAEFEIRPNQLFQFEQAAGTEVSCGQQEPGSKSTNQGHGFSRAAIYICLTALAAGVRLQIYNAK